MAKRSNPKAAMDWRVRECARNSEKMGRATTSPLGSPGRVAAILTRLSARTPGAGLLRTPLIRE